MDWFLARLQHANPTLDYKDLHSHSADFKKLVSLQIIKYTEPLETIACDLCAEEHSVAPFRNNKGELVLSCSGSRRIVDPDELKVWTINKDVLVENVKSKKAVISKTAFERTAFASKQNGDFYITRKGDEFYYKGDLLNLSKNPDWNKVFYALYDLIPEGGEVSYTKLGEQIKSKIKKAKTYNAEAMRKFIQTNLTDKSNGFKHYANIPAKEDNGKSLLSVNRGKGIIFNNKLA